MKNKKKLLVYLMLIWSSCAIQVYTIDESFYTNDNEEVILAVEKYADRDEWNSYGILLHDIVHGKKYATLQELQETFLWAYNVVRVHYDAFDDIPAVVSLLQKLHTFYQSLAESRAPRPGVTQISLNLPHDPHQVVPLPRDLFVERNGVFGGNITVEGNIIAQGGGSFQGTFLADAGSETFPAYSFINNPSDGIFHPPVAGTVSVSTAGSERLRIDANKIQQYTGQYQAPAGFAAAPTYSFSDAPTDGMYYDIGSSTLYFATNGTNRVGITDAGVIEISGSIGLSDGSAAAPAYTFASDTATGMYHAATPSTLAFSTAGVEKLSIDGVGNITQAAGQYYAPASSAAAPTYSFSDAPTDGMYYDIGSSTLYFATNGTNRVGITDAGVIEISGSIGVSDGSAAAPAYTFASDTATGMYHAATPSTLAFSTAGVERLAIDALGAVSLARAQFRAPDGSAAAPSYSFTTDTTTGCFYDALHNRAAYAVQGESSLTIGALGALTVPAISSLASPHITFERARNGGLTVQNGDILGGVYFDGADASVSPQQAQGALMQAVVTTAVHPVAPLHVPTDIQFFADTGLVNQEVFHITHAGAVQARMQALGVPAYTFIGDTSTGINNDAGVLELIVNGGVGLSINGAGTVTMPGAVQVGSITTLGTTTFDNNVIVNSSTLSRFGMRPRRTAIQYLQNDTLEQARIYSSIVPGETGLAMSIDGGVTNNLYLDPTGTFTVAPTGGTAPALQVSNTVRRSVNTIGIQVADTGTAAVLNMVGNYATINGADEIVLSSADVPCVSIRSTIVDPVVKVHSVGSGPFAVGIEIDDTGSSYALNCTGAQAIIHGASTLALSSNNVTRLSIPSSGNITYNAPYAAGIGGILPVRLLGADVAKNFKVAMAHVNGGAVTYYQQDGFAGIVAGGGAGEYIVSFTNAYTAAPYAVVVAAGATPAVAQIVSTTTTSATIQTFDATFTPAAADFYLYIIGEFA